MLYARYEQNQLLFNMRFKGQTAAEKVVVHLDPASPRRDTIRLLPAGSAARSAAL